MPRPSFKPLRALQVASVVAVVALVSGHYFSSQSAEAAAGAAPVKRSVSASHTGKKAKKAPRVTVQVRKARSKHRRTAPASKPGVVTVKVRQSPPLRRAPVPMFVMFATDEPLTASGTVPIVTNNGDFSAVQITAETVIRRGNSTVALSDIHTGSTLRCIGEWSTDGADFVASEVFLGPVLDDLALGRKITEACRKITARRLPQFTPTTSAPLTAGAAGSPAPAAAKPQNGVPAPASDAAAKPADTATPPAVAPSPAAAQPPATPGAPSAPVVPPSVVPT